MLSDSELANLDDDGIFALVEAMRFAQCKPSIVRYYLRDCDKDACLDLEAQVEVALVRRRDREERRARR